MKARIVYENDMYRYFDKNGTELHDGDLVQADNGDEHVLYLTKEHQLGIDATNPGWIRIGRAVPCQYGIYPLTQDDLSCMQKISIAK